MRNLLLIGLLFTAAAASADEGAVPQAVTALQDAEALRIAADDAAGIWNTGTYSYDPAGNITAIGTQYFLYDKLGRLTKAKVNADRAGTSPNTETYTYDFYGNLTSLSLEGRAPRNVTVSSGTNHLTDTGSVYDAAGNLAQWQVGSVTNVMTYDPLGMPAKVTAGGLAPRLYIYTADDERIWTFDLGPNQSHFTIRDVDGKVLRDYLLAGNTWSVWRDYYYRGDQMLASTTPTSEVHYSLDHLGTPRLLTSPTREQLAFQTFLPFGEEVSETRLADGAVKKFTAHERDSDFASQGDPLDYMHARFYSGRAGRFLSVDPTWDSADLGRPQSWNRYAYVRDNPVNATDPDGRILDTLADIAFAAYDVYDIVRTTVRGEPVRAVQNVALAADLVAIVIPGVTGAGAGVRAAAHAGEAVHAVEGAVHAADAGAHAVDAGAHAADAGTHIADGAAHGGGGGSRVNKVGPDPNAVGPHTSFKRSSESGRVNGYTTYDAAGNPVKRFRGEGRPHGGVDPPLVLEPKPGKGPGAQPKVPRKPTPDELPRGY